MDANSDNLAIATVVIFAALALPTLFTALRHGVRGMAILGWAYLFVFCSLKIIGSIMLLASDEKVYGSIVNNIGVSPLILAVAGVLHESQFYYASPAKRIQKQAAAMATTVAFHMFILLGIALVAAGLVKVNKDHGDNDKAWVICRVGGAIMVLGWLVLIGLTAQSCLAGNLKAHNSERRKKSVTLLTGVIVALPFLGVRVVSMLAYLITKNPAISSGSGTLGSKIYLYLIHEIIAALALLVAGLLSINITRKPDESAGNETETAYKMVQPLPPGELGAEESHWQGRDGF